jgi:hypothetical protein
MRLASILLSTIVIALVLHYPALAKDVDLQPLSAQAARVADALDKLGAPLSPEDRNALDAAPKESDPAKGVAAIERVLDPHCLLLVQINPESRVKVARGPAEAELVEGGWRTFLVKVSNEAGVTAKLNVTSPNAGKLAGSEQKDVPSRWLDVLQHTEQPLQARLSGLGVEYRVISLYSRDAGQREAKLAFDAGQGTQDLGFRAEQDVLFTAKPATEVTLSVLDEHGQPTMASFVIRDKAGRVYPSQAKRLAPDFAFHPQIYRGDGENLKLPPGKYTFEVGRGPEYLPERREVEVPAGPKFVEKFALKRWIDPAAMGWYSGDHHIHAAGCAHYSKPTEGVLASDMIRQTLGEDLKVGCNLTWGPCFDFQKQFFTGDIDKVSKYPYLLRYDVEVSGFGSHQSGHLVLLRLKDEIYPGGDSDKHWPTLGLNTLKWAKRQGAVVGPAHSGWGLDVKDTKLPNYTIPPYSGIGANEYVVDVTHEVPGPDGKPTPAVDFMSLVDTPSVWELNMWYHTLNCGFRTRGSGETDFPCIYGERVGLGRSYVRMGDKLDFDNWCEGIREGRNYVSDGMSHLIDFRVNDLAVGDKGSELRLDQPATVHVTAKVAALLGETPNNAIRNKPYAEQPYWSLERARLGDGREVPVELIVNGKPVARQTIAADGTMRDVSFDTKIDRSSWVAMRILPSSHTNPVFVLVGGKPIRPSRKSAEWCLQGVDACWAQKRRFIAAREMDDAKAAYDHAREVYRKIVAESEAD